MCIRDRRGTLFTHAVTNQPVCSPSRSVMLTGRYATETGVWHNAMPIDPSLPVSYTHLDVYKRQLWDKPARSLMTGRAAAGV